MFTMTTPSGETRNVTVGYDRMCGHFFLQVFRQATDPMLSEDDRLVYFSSYDPRFLNRNRTGAAFGGAMFEELEMCLDEQQITLPEGLRERLLEDGELQRGNDQKHW